MMVALSSGLSWLIFGGWLLAVVLIVAFFMGATQAEREFEESRTFTEPADPQLRIFGGIYDHEAQGDFEPQSELPEMGHPELRGGRP